MSEEMKEELEEQGVDVEAAVARFAGKAQRYMKYLKAHIETGYFTQLGEELELENVDEAQRLSHTLKGDFLSFEFGEIACTMKELNEQLKLGKMDGAMELYQSMTDKYSNITNIITNHA